MCDCCIKCFGARSRVGGEVELQKFREGPFWERATAVFRYIDAFLNGLGDGIITVGELRKFFKGDNMLAEYFVIEIDEYARYHSDAWDLTAADDGQITLDEWYSFIDYLSDKSKSTVEEGLSLFEKYMSADPQYSTIGRRKGALWERCNAVFDAVDSGLAKGDGQLTYKELKIFFRGDDKLAKYFNNNIDLYVSGSTTIKDSGDGVITLLEWYSFFDFLNSKSQIEVLRALAQFERYMKISELSSHYLVEGSKIGGHINKDGEKEYRAIAVERKGPIWKRVNALFDAIDAKSSKNCDGDITQRELQKFFNQTPELKLHYQDNVAPHLSQKLVDDAIVTLDEWYAHFEKIASDDPRCNDSNVDHSYAVAKELTFIENQAGLTQAHRDAVGQEKQSSFSHGKIWNRIRKIFDLVDSQFKKSSDNFRNNELSLEELRQFFKGDERVAEIYLADLDEYSHEVTARDGYVSLEEWHDYFQGVANQDKTCPSNNVEESVAVKKKIQIFEKYIAMSHSNTETKLNQQQIEQKPLAESIRPSEKHASDQSALMEAKISLKATQRSLSRSIKKGRLESKIIVRQTKRQERKSKKRKAKKTKKNASLTTT